MGDNPKYPSPCLTCARVPDPGACENKRCRVWRQWWIDRWALIQAYGQKRLGQEEPRSVEGNAEETDPCAGCICAEDLCATPCRKKRTWLQEKGDTHELEV